MGKDFAGRPADKGTSSRISEVGTQSILRVDRGGGWAIKLAVCIICILLCTLYVYGWYSYLQPI